MECRHLWSIYESFFKLNQNHAVSELRLTVIYSFRMQFCSYNLSPHGGAVTQTETEGNSIQTTTISQGCWPCQIQFNPLPAHKIYVFKDSDNYSLVKKHLNAYSYILYVLNYFWVFDSITLPQTSLTC